MITSEDFECFLTCLSAKIDRTVDLNKPKWICGKDGDKLGNAREVAQDLELDFDEILNKYFTHVCCDCELLFNAPEPN